MHCFLNLYYQKTCKDIARAVKVSVLRQVVHYGKSDVRVEKKYCLF